jgi:hypothetical protein
METTIKEQMDALNLRPTEPTSVSSEHEILTDEEKQAILSQATRAKEAKIRLQNHWQAVKEAPLTIHDISAQDLWDELSEDPTFHVDETNKEVVKRACLYFGNDPDFETLDPSYSLKKGLFLFGGVGIGKTFIMNRFRQSQAKHAYRMADCSDIAALFAKGGEDAIVKYFKDSEIHELNRYGFTKAGWCFDDLGIESDGRYFGTQKNVMERILEVRYRSAVPLTTHMISNLTAPQLRERYGERIIDRMSEMFNLITFPKEAKSRRR